MENIIITVICFSLIVVGTLNLSMSSFTSIDVLADSWKSMQSEVTDIKHTEITPVSSTTYDAGSSVEIAIRNDGSTPLYQFDRWDVIVRYETGDVQWLPYTTDTPGWSVDRILYNGNPEIYEPNVINPGEEVYLILKLSPAVAAGTTNLVTVSTFNGVISETTFGY
jgi:hypothetical protein